MNIKNITQIDLNNKIVFIRSDMNVPHNGNQISDDTRIIASLKTINYALDNGAKVIVATHLGRPIEGTKLSVEFIAKKLSELLNKNVLFIKDLKEKINFSETNIVMLENVRCNVGEKANSDELGKQYASLCDIFVHDAFATAHRAEASTDSIGKYVKEVCAGILFNEEIEALIKVFDNPKRPLTAIVAGSKVSTKLHLLSNFANKVDYLIVGGGILNTFLKAKGCDIKKSLVENSLIEESNKIISLNNNIPLPKDVVVAKELSINAKGQEKNINQLDNDDIILDIGKSFIKELTKIIENSRTIIWNGPVGVFEYEEFSNGTKKIAEAIASSDAYCLAGGGDTIAALKKFNLYEKIDFVSTAGGALLEFFEGKELPAIKLLTNRTKE